MVGLTAFLLDLESGTLDAKAIEGFGDRLASIRKSRGLTQAQLGDALGVTKRNIAYYETDGGQPPGPMLPELANTLNISIDELLGVKPVRKIESPKTARLMNRLRRVQELPPTDQRAVLKYIDSLYREHQQVKKAKRSKRTAS